VDPGNSLDDMEKLKLFTVPGLELQPLGHPVCSQSLNRLRYHSLLPHNETQHKIRYMVKITVPLPPGTNSVPIKINNSLNLQLINFM
jgi:hypothetical protein